MTLMCIGKRLIVALCVCVVSCSSLSKNEVDLRALTKIMSHPEFIMYLHPEVSGRLPVVIVSNGGFSSDLRLSKFGRDVTILGEGESEASVVFKKYDRQGNRITFEIDYGIEGVVYTGVLKVEAGEINFVSTEVGEL